MNRTKLKIISVIMSISFFLSAAAWALPRDGSVVSGASTITKPDSQTMHIQQTTDKSIINWQGYSIGASEKVQYFQPGSSSISLNRVTGQDPSRIYGQLSANGQVWVINPNGLLVGAGAKINVGSFLGSTLNISDHDFLSGNYKFRQEGALSSIVNQGAITSQNGGYVVLISPSITNEGSVTSNLGKSYLASGSEVTLSFAGNDLIGFTVDKEAAAAALGITNKGTISANGGEVIVSAEVASDLIKTVVNNEGVIEAKTMEEKNGRIYLLGGMEHNAVEVSGKLDASAPAGGNGGFIETSAAKVKVADSAVITTAAPYGKTGKWLIDPTDYYISASGGDISGLTLSNNLFNTVTGTGSNIEILSSSGSKEGNGDIFVNDAVSWSQNMLTLTAARDININAVMTASGTSALTMNTGGGVAGGTVKVGFAPGEAAGFAGRVDFGGRSGAGFLNINGNGYTVINSLGNAGSVTGTDLQGIGGPGKLGGYYALGDDIIAGATSGWNLNGGVYNGFAPLGNGGAPFTGVFDGLGHTISNLYINRPATDNVGLFGYSSGNAIRNVGLTGGSVTGNDSVGGLVGVNTGIIRNTYNTGIIDGSVHVGGLVGMNWGGVSNSYNTGNIGSIDAFSQVGGIAGQNSGVISNSYNTGRATAGVGYVGGVAGENTFGGVISNSYSTGEINQVSIGGNGAGGLVGFNGFGGSISNSYSTGKVTGVTDVGGLVGPSSRSVSIVTNSFWNTETSGQATSNGGVGKTTAQMKQLATFKDSGWNIDDTGGTGKVWRIYDGNTYPLLRSFLTPLNVAANNVTKTYDGATYSGGSGVTYSPSDGIVLGTLTYSGTSQGAKNAGSYTLTPSGLYSNQQGYDIIASGSLTVTPKTLTIAGSVASNKVYDGNTTATVTAGTLSGMVGAESLGVSGSGFFDNKNVGTGKDVAATYTLSDGTNGGLAGNYSLGGQNLTADITPKGLTLNGLTAVNKVYDGNNTAAVSGYGSLTGVIVGDTVNLNSSSAEATFDTKDKGIGKTVTVEKLALNGGDSANYSIGNQTTAADITPKTLNIAGSVASNKVYDGNTTATVTAGTLSGMVGTESLGVSGSGLFDNKNVGTGKDVAATYTLSDGTNGGRAGNYSLGGQNLTADITPKALAIAGSVASNKVYDGNTTATVTAGTLSGMVGAESLGVTGSGLFDNKNVGTGKDVAATYTLSDGTNGGLAGNYSLGNQNLIANIDPAPLTVAANNDGKVYDGLAYFGGAGVVYNGLVNGETPSDLGGLLKYSGGSQGAINPGAYAITPGGLLSGNYTITYIDGALTITPLFLGADNEPLNTEVYYKFYCNREQFGNPYGSRQPHCWTIYNESDITEEVDKNNIETGEGRDDYQKSPDAGIKLQDRKNVSLKLN